MKKILYVAPGLNPLSKNGVSNRVESFAKCFQQNGYRVYIAALCSPSNYIKTVRNKRLFDSRYKWIVIPFIFSFSSPLNVLAIFHVKLLLAITAMIYRCKLVLADYTSGAEVASWTKICAKLIVNHRGDSVDEFMMLANVDDSSAGVAGLKKYLTKSVDYADYSVCVSNNLKNNIESRTGKTIKNCFIFPCCADISRFENVVNDNNRDHIYIGYFGSLSKWQCIDEAILLYKVLKKKDQRYRFILLSNSNWDQYKKELDEIGDYTVESIPSKDMPQFIAKMDVSIALREARPLNIVSSPTKLSESLAAGVPVIVTKATGDYAEIISNGETGIILNDPHITEEDVEVIHNFCMKVKNDKNAFVKKCRFAVKDRTWNNYSQAFVKFVDN